MPKGKGGVPKNTHISAANCPRAPKWYKVDANITKALWSYILILLQVSPDIHQIHAVSLVHI